MHGVSTVSRKILLLRAFSNGGCSNGSSTAAKGMPYRISTDTSSWPQSYNAVSLEQQHELR